MYQALYRKYRPKTFDDVVGQKVIIKTLSNSILNNKITHAYLFTGPRGTGKTSIAKIMAKIVNCESLNEINPCNKCVNCTQTNNKQNTDIIEIDAASNNGVDEIRELRDKVSLVPSYGKYKIYIIDEVHMLTTAAFNALLKTLEEPPSHVIFILATTEPYKIPTTILSRCQRYDFKKINTADIVKRLSQICEQENIKIEREALDLIANLSDGGMRDSISLLDQLTSYTIDKITLNDVHDVYGTITNNQILELLSFIYNNKLKDSLNLVNEYDSDGKNLIKIMEIIINYLKNVLVYLNSSEYFKDPNEKKSYSKICNMVDEPKIYKSIEIFMDSIKVSKGTNNIKLIFELAIIKIIELSTKNEIDAQESVDEILDKKVKIKVKNEIIKPIISDGLQKKLKELQKKRINNTLSNFDKKELMAFKIELDKIKELLLDPNYSSIVSLILDGELKAKGHENLIFVYQTNNLEDCFNLSLKQIENVFNISFNKNYKPIAVSENEWEIIKNDFNHSLKSSKSKYIYEEGDSLDMLYNLNEDIEKSLENVNEIEENFQDLIVYN